MNLNDLLAAKRIEAHQVLVFRHRPTEARLNRVLPWLAAERPAVFNAYQQAQGEKVENAMQRAKYVASFIRREGCQALFVGLYAIGKTTPLTREQFWKVQGNIELKKFDMDGFREADPRRSILWFDLEITDFHAEWKGKLVVDWPPPERSWWRWAHKNDIQVRAILEDSALEPHMTDWKEMVLSWQEIAAMPSRWRSALSEWRGIYYISDISDGKGYVGSAYGDNNLLGRWMDYAASGHGGNRLLRGRDPRNFRFSILQRVSPDMDAEDVIRLENTWKGRLHSRQPQGLNDN